MGTLHSGLALCLLCLAPSCAPAPAEPVVREAARSGKAAIVQDYPIDPAIWKIADANTTIYLFGTHHALRPGFKWRSAKLDRIIAEADELVEESVDGPDADKNFDDIMDARTDRPPLAQRIAAGKRPQLKRALADIGVPEDGLDTMPTWLAAFVIGLMHMERAGDDQALGVESVLEKLFRDAGKPISAVEDGDAVLRSFRDVPEAEQVALLEDAISDLPEIDAETLQGDHDWAKGDAEHAIRDLGPEELGPALYDLLITRRNAAWSEWLVKRLDKPGTVLFAVGAGHLAGPDSVQKMMAAKGIRAERLR